MNEVVRRLSKGGHLISIEDHLKNHAEVRENLIHLKNLYGDKIGYKIYEDRNGVKTNINIVEIMSKPYIESELKKEITNGLKESLKRQEISQDVFNSATRQASENQKSSLPGMQGGTRETGNGTGNEAETGTKEKGEINETGTNNSGTDKGNATGIRAGGSFGDSERGKTDESIKRNGNGTSTSGSVEQTTTAVRRGESGTKPDSSIDEIQQPAGNMGRQRTPEHNGENIPGDKGNSMVQPANAKDNSRVTENYDLRDKEPIRLSKGQRKTINSKVKEILSRNPKPQDLTDDERELLRQYTGEGGLSSGDTKEALTQHYTDYPVIKAMFDALINSGFKFKTAIETAVGNGNFIGMYLILIGPQ